jgi:hypothetical protein
MKRIVNTIEAQMRIARRTWAEVGSLALRDLRSLLVGYNFSVNLITLCAMCHQCEHRASKLL